MRASKYGGGIPAACYASSIGIHDRATATTLAANCPYPEPAFRQFLDWLSQLTTDEITTLTHPDTARLLIRSTERRSHRATQAAILSSTGTFTCPLRGVRHSGNDAHLAQLPIGTPLGPFLGQLATWGQQLRAGLHPPSDTSLIYATLAGTCPTERLTPHQNERQMSVTSVISASRYRP
ncbi:hypothetical protein [Streptomyces sp. NPDC051662]|uniref:hypothetical protein n=1 Tax=Streptomyces sp. NPDC051662 TaxID=3154750 RepID=UPI0034305E57